MSLTNDFIVKAPHRTNNTSTRNLHFLTSSAENANQLKSIRPNF